MSRTVRMHHAGDTTEPDASHPAYASARRVYQFFRDIPDRTDRLKDRLVRIVERQVFRSGEEDTEGLHPLSVQLLLRNPGGRYDWIVSDRSIIGAIALQIIFLPNNRVIFLDHGESRAWEFADSELDQYLTRVYGVLGIPHMSPVGS